MATNEQQKNVSGCRKIAVNYRAALSDVKGASDDALGHDVEMALLKVDVKLFRETFWDETTKKISSDGKR